MLPPTETCKIEGKGYERYFVEVVALFGRGAGPCGWVGPQGPSRAAELVAVPNRAGPGGAGGARRGCGGAEPLGSRASTAVLPRSRLLRPLIGLQPFRLPSEERLGNGRNERGFLTDERAGNGLLREILPRPRERRAARLGGRGWTHKWTDGWMSVASEQPSLEHLQTPPLDA
ncbi:hypothetical protein DV515_00003847 [Chloebia gouldiae]|uniref:Uncharacterized protein n=1 Tax=Chloebia gouldiae TaxID=44316 RepID=A0A3L8SU31_CHLGU|nr:hypothetical protein DV515_00003847 [Chloebia gouldiae]